MIGDGSWIQMVEVVFMYLVAGKLWRIYFCSVEDF